MTKPFSLFQLCLDNSTAMFRCLLRAATSNLQAAWRAPVTTCRTLVSTTKTAVTLRLTGFTPSPTGLRPALLAPQPAHSWQVQTYKAPSAIHKRCPGCYIVKRKGRLFVECKLKPRHKQMQRMSKRKLYRED